MISNEMISGSEPYEIASCVPFMGNGPMREDMSLLKKAPVLSWYKKDAL
jgi:hypothetical protein